MKCFKGFVKAILVISLCYLMFPQKAYAYFDPGTGSYFIQILAGFLLGALFIVKLFFHKVKAFFCLLLGRGKKNGKSGT